MGIEGFEPIETESERWVVWKVHFTLGTCLLCALKNEKICGRDELLKTSLPIHPNCHCTLEALGAILAGTATIDKLYGADYNLKQNGGLPGNYIDKGTAKRMGWNPLKGNLREKIPNAMIGGNVFANKNKRLPEMAGRIWYEADINYTGGFRNEHRILYSNDGIIFVTYDHYTTFYEIR